MKLSKKYIDVWLKLYSCNVDKNEECNKKNCKVCHRDIMDALIQQNINMQRKHY